MLHLFSHVNTVFRSVSYIVYDDVINDCVIIDVGDTKEILDIIAPFKLKTILLTHVHYDHIYGLNELLASDQNLCIVHQTTCLLIMRMK